MAGPRLRISARLALIQETICGETSWNSSIIRCDSGRSSSSLSSLRFSGECSLNRANIRL
ncbi:hypothetical protein D3C81_2089890 [compost metagenome]